MVGSDWVPFAKLVAFFVPLLLVERWLGRHIHGLGLMLSQNQQVAVILWYLVELPGVVLHELSHVVAARLVGVKTFAFSLKPRRSRRGITFGSVQVAASDPLRETWIGVAPLLVGSVAILLIARHQFGVNTAGAPSLLGLMPNLLDYIRTPDAGIWVYLIFAISSAMMPSESDRRPWLLAGAFLAVVGAAVYLLGLAPWVLPVARQWVLTAVEQMTFAFAVGLLVSICVAAAVFLAEIAGQLLTHRYVQYR